MPWLATTGPSILYGPLFVVWFSWLAAAIGRRALFWLGAGEAPVSQRALAALAIGVGALQFVPFGLGAAGLLSPTALRVALALLSLAFCVDLIAIARALPQALRSLPRPPTPVSLLAGALAPALLTAALLALTPTLDPDGLSYHLAVPKRWFETGSLDYLPTYSYSNTPMGIEMLFAIGLACGGDISAKLLHLVFGVVAAASIRRCGVALNAPRAGTAAAVLYLVGPAGVAALLGWAYLEGIIAFALATATLAWLSWIQSGDRGWLRTACLLVGISVSFKITAVLLPVVLGSLTLVHVWLDARRRNAPVAPALVRTLGLLPLMLAPVLPWFTRSALVTGNPFFPLFAGLIPSRDYSPALSKHFETYNRYFTWASARSWSLDQRKLILAATTLVVLLLAAVIFTRQKSALARAAVVALTGVTVIQLGACGLYVRYWVPMLSVFVVVLLAPAEGLLARAASSALGRGLLLALALLFSLSKTKANLDGVGRDVKGLVLAAIGLESQRDFALRHLPLFPLYEHANRGTAAGSRVLLTYYCGGGFHLDRRAFCAEFVQDALRFTTWEDFNSDIERLGITHILAPTALTLGGSLPPVDPAAPSKSVRVREDEYLARLLRARGKLLETASDQGLYSIEKPSN